MPNVESDPTFTPLPSDPKLLTRELALKCCTHPEVLTREFARLAIELATASHSTPPAAPVLENAAANHA